MSRGIPPSWSRYARPYPASKYHANAVWVLKDAGLEGNLFNEYYMGGFLGFWLAPELRAATPVRASQASPGESW